MSKLPRITSFLFLRNILRKKLVMKFIFACRYACKFPTNWYYDFNWGSSSILKVPKMASLQCLHNISEKKLEMKLISCMQINIKVSYKLISALWASRFSRRWYCHYWLARSSILKKLKVTSLQYLYKISKNKLDGLHF